MGPAAIIVPLREVESIAKQDPFIANNAMTYKRYTWQHCVAADKTAP